MDVVKIHEVSRTCQRNWDLTKTIPNDHLDMFEYIVENPASKQGYQYYDAIFSTNREINEKIYNFAITEEDITADTIVRGNPQMLAHLVILWIYDLDELFKSKQLKSGNLNFSDKKKSSFTDTAHIIMGINAGNLSNMAATLGYKTAFCRCFQDSSLEQRQEFLSELGIINSEKKDIILGLGIGINDHNKDNRTDHYADRTFKKHNLIKPKVFKFSS